jgi:TPR repeat protein
MEVRTMKRVFLFAMIACLCLAAWGGAALGEAAATEEAASVSAEELLQAGKDAYEAKDYGKALECWQQAADQGDAKALCYLGNLYREGNGVEQSYEKALEYWQKAADQGDTLAMCNLGGAYYNARGVEQSYEKALE